MNTIRIHSREGIVNNIIEYILLYLTDESEMLDILEDYEGDENVIIYSDRIQFENKEIKFEETYDMFDVMYIIHEVMKSVEYNFRVQDLIHSKSWPLSSIVEVDRRKRRVLIHFDRIDIDKERKKIKIRVSAPEHSEVDVWDSVIKFV